MLGGASMEEKVIKRFLATLTLTFSFEATKKWLKSPVKFFAKKN
jgi:hypothetical protein